MAGQMVGGAFALEGLRSERRAMQTRAEEAEEDVEEEEEAVIERQFSFNDTISRAITRWGGGGSAG